MNQQDALLERYGRLHRVAEEVVAGAEAIGSTDHPMCSVEPHLIRALRRELSHPREPQPSGGMFWMGSS